MFLYIFIIVKFLIYPSISFYSNLCINVFCFILAKAIKYFIFFIIMQQGYKALASIATKHSQKLVQKIKNKDFLLGKFYDLKKPKKSKPKCFCKDKQFKIGRLLEIQSKILDVPNLISKSNNEEMIDEKKQSKIQQSNNEHLFELYQPLNNLWQQYMKELLGDDKNQESICLKILRGDLHGAYITIIASKINHMIGIEGIVIKESLKTFVIVTKQNKIMTLMKNIHSFVMKLGQRNFVMHGPSLIYRPSDRIKHKYKFRKAQQYILDFLGSLNLSKQEE